MVPSESDFSDSSDESSDEESKQEDEEETEAIDLLNGFEVPAASRVQGELELVAAICASQVADATENRVFGTLPVVEVRSMIQPPATELEELRSQVQKLLSQSSTQDDRTYNVNRYSVLIAGVGAIATVAGAAFTGYAAMRSQNNSSGPTLPSTASTPLIASLMRQSNDLPDSAFWNALAAYVAANRQQGQSLTLADQYQFMTYVMDLWPLVAPLFWTQADAVAARDAMLQAYQSGDATEPNSTPAMYRAVPAYTTSEGQALPRAIAAQVLQWVLAGLIINDEVPRLTRRKQRIA